MQDFAPGFTGPVSEEASQADGKPQLRLTYEQIAHLHTKDFERGVCKNDFIQKYSKYDNILQFLHVFRSRTPTTSSPVREHRVPLLLGQEES